LLVRIRDFWPHDIAGGSVDDHREDSVVKNRRASEPDGGGDGAEYEKEHPVMLGLGVETT
jgi:hypothetical protein